MQFFVKKDGSSVRKEFCIICDRVGIQSEIQNNICERCGEFTDHGFDKDNPEDLMVVNEVGYGPGGNAPTGISYQVLSKNSVVGYEESTTTGRDKEKPKTLDQALKELEF